MVTNKTVAGLKSPLWVLSRTTLFRDMPIEELEHLIVNPRRILVPKHSCVFNQGDPATSLYFIEHGQVLMQTVVSSKVRRIDQNITVETQSMGEIIGLSSLIKPYINKFSACVEQDVVCIAFDAEPIRQKLNKSSRLAALIYERVSEILLGRLSKIMEISAHKY